MSAMRCPKCGDEEAVVLPVDAGDVERDHPYTAGIAYRVDVCSRENLPYI